MMQSASDCSNSLWPPNG